MNIQIRFRWSDEMKNDLLVNYGPQSAATIAKRLHITRNAVIGQATRLGLGRKRGERLKRPPTPRIKRSKVAFIPKPPKKYEPPPMPIAPLNIQFADLEKFHCREIVGYGDYGLSLSCGHPPIKDSSFCSWHHSINYAGFVWRPQSVAA